MLFTKFLTGIALIGLTTLALAQGQIEFKNVAHVERQSVDAETGETSVTLEEAKLVKPGEVVVFTSTYTNISDQAAQNIRVTNPIPDNMIYVNFSARGANSVVTYSVDGKSFAAPNQLSVTEDDGSERPATAKDYQAIQWQITEELAPGASGTVSFKARLL